MKMYSVFDKVVAEFAPPFVAKNDATAVRNFMLGARKMPTVNDFQMFCVGEWNPENKAMPFLCDSPDDVYEVPINMSEEI